MCWPNNTSTHKSLGTQYDFIYLSILLLCSYDASSSIFTEKKIKHISQELKASVKAGDLKVADNYLYEGTQIYIDVDPDPAKGMQKISLETYRELIELSVQLMDQTEIEEEIIAITIDHEQEKATLVEKSTVNTSVTGMNLHDVSVSTTVFGVVNGAIKILSITNELVSMDIKSVKIQKGELQSSNASSQAMETFTIGLEESDDKIIDHAFRQQYLPICLALIKSAEKADSSQLCSKTVSIIQQVANHLNSTPVNKIKQNHSCQTKYQSIEKLLSCVTEQTEALTVLMEQGIEMAMCAFPGSTVVLDDGWNHRTQRGTQVYREYNSIVDCELKQFNSLVDEGFYPPSLVINEGYSYRWEDYFDPIYKALQLSDKTSIERFIQQYTFNEDELRDNRLIELLIADEDYFPWLKMLIEHHQPRLNFNVEYYNQPLSYAIEVSNNQKTALFLLEHGADPFIPYKYGQSHLQLAARSGMYDLVKVLLIKGMDPDGLKGSDRSYFGQPLIEAARRGDQAIFDLLLTQGALLKPLNPADYPNWQADDLFSQAVHGDNLKIIETLLEKGVKVPSSQKTLVNLISRNEPNMMVFLRNHGLTLPPVIEHKYLFATLSDVIKRADLKTLENAFSIFNHLDEMGFDLSQSFNPNKSLGYQLIYNNLTTALTFETKPDDTAIKNLRNSFAQAALTASIKDGIDINQSNENQTTLLMHAAKLGQHQLIKSLLDYGANTELKDEDGLTALMIAEKQVKQMSAYHPTDSLMIKKYHRSIQLLKQSP